MKLLPRLRTWWQVRSGHDDTPLDGDSPIWLVSFFFHLALLVSLSLLLIPPKVDRIVEVLMDPIEAPIQPEEMPAEFRYVDTDSDRLGANSEFGAEMAPQIALEVSEAESVELETPSELRETGEFIFNDTDVLAMAEKLESVAVKGKVGVAATGASGAVDRIVEEIIRSMEERKTLVVWMFDRTPSMARQRDEILARFDHVYDELSAIEATGAAAFAQYDEQPLLTQVCAFGEQLDYAFKRPTEDLVKIKEAIRSITTTIDTSGVENVFSSISAVVGEYRDLRRIDSRTGDRERNVMIIVVTDEAGDDTNMLDAAVIGCQKYVVPVYVIGVPAPFGRVESEVKWVDPDPNFDQSPQWATVNQGPETLYPERIRLKFAGEDEDALEFIDSGFGPFGLTRVCYESGGIYFTVHPNRERNGLRRWETSEFAAYLTHFFDPAVMTKYRPDYVSVASYQRELQENQARFALVQAAQQSWVTPLEAPDLVFTKFEEAEFVNRISEAQRAAATVEPKLNRLFEILKVGEADRDLELSARWKAGFDLAYGSVLAAKIRAESYNEMLAMAKTNLKFNDPKNNTWRLVAADTITTGSQSAKLGEKAKTYLQRVLADHPNTPWSLLAQKEIDTPIGWRWVESYTKPPTPPSEMQIANNNNNVRRPQAEAAQMLAPPKVRRPPPKL